MRRPLAGVAVVAALVAASGCSAVTQTFVPQLKVGECAAPLAGQSEIEKIPKVACSQPHAWEAYASMQVPGQAYPPTADLDKRADEFCGAQYATYVGIPVERSQYDWTSLTPTEGSWALGDREILCLVGDEAGGIVGSLKGSQK